MQIVIILGRTLSGWVGLVVDTRKLPEVDNFLALLTLPGAPRIITVSDKWQILHSFII